MPKYSSNESIEKDFFLIVERNANIDSYVNL